jgi:hypothetical protein
MSLLSYAYPTWCMFVRVLLLTAPAASAVAAAGSVAAAAPSNVSQHWHHGGTVCIVGICDSALPTVQSCQWVIGTVLLCIGSMLACSCSRVQLNFAPASYRPLTRLQLLYCSQHVS